jgi:hypothetical protein
MLVQRWMIAVLLQLALLAVAARERVSHELGMTAQPPVEIVSTGDPL